MKRRPLLSAFALWISGTWWDRIITPPRKGIISLLQYFSRKAGKP